VRVRAGHDIGQASGRQRFAFSAAPYCANAVRPPPPTYPEERDAGADPSEDYILPRQIFGAPANSCRDVLSYTVDGDNMIRTQISLDEQEYALVKTGARALGISVAEFVRRAVREALPPRGRGPWMKFAGFVETGDPRSSQCVDEIVYGQKD